MVTACLVGDVINSGKNFVAAINTEGLLFIFDVINPCDLKKPGSPNPFPDSGSNTLTRGASSAQNLDSLSQTKKLHPKIDSNALKLDPLYDQRMPANCKELLLADLDGDGQNEVIVGLTDRVLRTYKWIKIGPDRGKFVGLYKWEFADQIGAVSLNPSQHEKCQDIIVAQPGGTYAKLECFDKKSTIISNSTSSSSNEHRNVAEDTQSSPIGTSTDNSDNVRTEYISKLTPEYHQLALAQMRNHHISTEVLGGIRDGKNSDSYSLIVIATLDGTLMLVNKDEILWSLQVDHQLFALAILESKFKTKPLLTQSESSCTIVANAKLDHTALIEQMDDNFDVRKSQYFVVCAWNGKTYIIDEERNYLRFKFDEAVSAFTAGNYYFNGKEHESLVYATFNNQIVLYYDVILDQIRPMYLLNEVMNNPNNASLLAKLETLAAKISSETGQKFAEKCEGDRISESGMYTLLSSVLFSLIEDEFHSQEGDL